MMCNPRPVSAREPGVRGAGAAVPGSATAHSTQGPGRGRPSRTGRPARVSPGRGRACRSALVSSSDTTIAMSGPRSAMPRRRKMATVKYRAARTDRASASSARVAIRGGQAQPVRAGSGGDRQLPPARPAISAAGISQPQPVLPARRGRCAIVAARSMSSRRQNRRVHVPGSSDPRCSYWPGPGAAQAAAASPPGPGRISAPHRGNAGAGWAVSPPAAGLARAAPTSWSRSGSARLAGR